MALQVTAGVLKCIKEERKRTWKEESETGGGREEEEEEDLERTLSALI